MAVTSAMIGLGYGPFPPMTWPEGLLWIFIMISVAMAFAFLNSLITAGWLLVVGWLGFTFLNSYKATADWLMVGGWWLVVGDRLGCTLLPQLPCDYRPVAVVGGWCMGELHKMHLPIISNLSGI